MDSHSPNHGAQVRGAGGSGGAGQLGYTSQISDGRQPSPGPSPSHLTPHPYLSSEAAGTPRIASLRIAPLDLGFLPSASTSQTSLLEAVVGPKGPAQHAPSALSRPPPSGNTPRRGSSASQSRVPSDGSQSFGTSTEREWDVLSDASLNLNKGEPDVEAVQELEKKVNKRRSNLPHLESELAELEAQIKAAEERLARVQAGKNGSGAALSGQTA